MVVSRVEQNSFNRNRGGTNRMVSLFLHYPAYNKREKGNDEIKKTANHKKKMKMIKKSTSLESPHRK